MYFTWHHMVFFYKVFFFEFCCSLWAMIQFKVVVEQCLPAESLGVKQRQRSTQPSLWAYVHCMAWHTELSWAEWMGEWGWVDGMCDKGEGRGVKRGERKEPSYMWIITKFHSVSGAC
jgi:hypothetical protein